MNAILNLKRSALFTVTLVALTACGSSGDSGNTSAPAPATTANPATNSSNSLFNPPALNPAPLTTNPATPTSPSNPSTPASPQTGPSSTSSTQLVYDGNRLSLSGGQGIVVGNIYLNYQTDGNVVIYNEHVTPVWSANAPGQDCSAGCQMVFQADGNLVLYKNGTAYWSINTAGNPGARLVFTNSAPYLAVYSATNTPLWYTLSSGAQAIGYSAGAMTLDAGQGIMVAGMRVEFQGDCNLVVYPASGSYRWSSNSGVGGCGANSHAVFQGDGNLVIYKGGSAIWSSGTAGNANSVMRFSNQSPYLSIQNSANQQVWASN